jgi:hypothetical protein
MQKRNGFLLGLMLCCGGVWAVAGPLAGVGSSAGPLKDGVTTPAAARGVGGVGACCYHDPDGVLQCVVMSFGECQQVFHGVYQGDGTNCNPSPCDQLPTGACCYSVQGTPPQCAVLFAIECELLQGQYLGDGTVCNPNSCDPTGACCYRDAAGQWVCVIVTSADCDALYGGLYQGDGTNCGPPLPCEGTLPNGACCYLDAVGMTQCVVVSAYECDVVYHGVYHGDGTSCGPLNPCTELGACCYGDPGGTFCVITTPADCQTIYQGTFQGLGTMCTPQGGCPNQEGTGACCYAMPPLCIITTQNDCSNIYGGVYMGNNTTCSPNPCLPPDEGACCVLDNTGNSVCVTATQVQCEELLHGVFHGVGSTCLPDTCPNVPPNCDCPGRCDNRTPAFEDPNFALVFTGAAAVCTHYDPFVSGYSVVCVDLKNKGSAPLNTNWNTTTLYSHASWTLANLGTVFGVTVDRSGNVYVTTSTSYFTHLTGLSGVWGTVYKINAVTGLPSVFANLPNTGPGLGNICFDAGNNQFFVTNFEDGRIYRLDMAGNCLSTFDHASGIIGTCVPEAGDPAGFATLGERPWGVNVWNNRLYYGLWVEDAGRPSATANNQVWSIPLAGGNFSGVKQLEITLPVLGAWYNYASPPSDLSFSQNGCMLVSERTMYSDDGPSAHQSRVLEYRQIGPVWWPSTVSYQVGVIAGGANSSGGGDYDKDGDVWATGDALQFGPQVIYGLQGLPCDGGGVTTSILVDLNGNLSFQDKTLLGDVEVTCFGPRGACCFLDPTGPQCAVMSEIECEQLQGLYLGDGTTCDPNPCEPTGACCYGVPTQCIVTTQTECLNTYNGTYIGDNVPCTPDPCPPQGEGACCVHDNGGNSFCVTATQTQCEQLLNGVFFGVGTPCTPTTCPNTSEKCDCPGRCDSHTPTFEDPAFLPFTGAAAIVTHHDPFVTGYSLVCVDIKNKGTAPLNTNWNTTTLYSHPSWALANLGTVFGVTVDKDGNIYVTASTSYWSHVLGSGTWGTVYKIDANTALPSIFANLPNTGPGLGNITYDAAGGQLFVTNFEDGRIYRLDMTGACLGTFDHATGLIGTCAPEAGDPAGFATLGERPWGVNVWNNRLYYGLWTEDDGRPSATAANTIWSIALVGGNFSGSAQLEITLPTIDIWSNWSNPPSDISFSRTGCMLVSERTMYSDDGPSAHRSRVLEYRQIGPIWWPSPVTYQVGVLGIGANSSGGADFDEDGGVWATGDALQFGPQVIYGLQGLPCTGGDVTQSILVDLNGNLTFQDKTLIGDVEVTCFGNCTRPPRRMVAWFPLDETSGTTALDIAWGNHGGYSGPTSILGMVQKARRFNGVSDFVSAPNAAQLNFGTGNYSFDAWVRSTSTQGVVVILDKRNSLAQGYSFYLYNGRPGMQIGDGAGYVNYAPLLSIADGAWHHMAVTVNRTSATGIKFYVDGNFVQAFDPLPYPGSVSNTNPLWIGVREPALGGGGYFPGDLDEIELFNAELSPTAILKVYLAGHAGKCKERAYLPPVTNYCPNELVKTVPFTIYNDSGNTYTHNWFLLGNTNCAVPGPLATGFSPQNMTGVVIPGHMNQTWPINITRPAGLVAPLSACYNATVTNTTLGSVFGTSAALRAVGWKWCIIIWDPQIGVLEVPFPGHALVSFDVTNTDSQPATLEYQVVAASSDGDAENRVVHLNGLPPGVPVIGTLTVAPGATEPITVAVSLDEHQPFNFHDIILQADTDGDGVPEPLEAIGLQSVALRPGDLNCDGVVDFDDVNPFVLAISSPEAYALAYPDCNFLNGDCNGDEIVDFDDINPFVALLSGG